MKKTIFIILFSIMLTLPVQAQEASTTPTKSGLFVGYAFIPVSIKYKDSEDTTVDGVEAKAEDYLPTEGTESRFFIGKNIDKNITLMGYFGSLSTDERHNTNTSLFWNDTNGRVTTRGNITSADIMGFLGQYQKIFLNSKNGYYVNFGYRRETIKTELDYYDNGRLRINGEEEELDDASGLEWGLGLNLGLSENVVMKLGVLSGGSVSSGVNIGIAYNF